MRTASVGIGNLLVWIILATNIFAQSGLPGGHDAGVPNADSPLYLTPDYGTNLWLSLNLSNSAIHLLLHNTQPGMTYRIRSREKLISGSWLDEVTVTGATAVTTTAATLNSSGRTNSLFIQAYSWMTNTAGGTASMMAISGERIMVVTHNGDVISWGGNGYGELGDYTHLESTNPVHAVGLTGITKIASGLNYSLAIDSNGTLWAWGQLDESEDQTNVPTPVPGMTNITAIAAYGQEGSSDPVVAVKSDGTVWMWGISDCDTYGVVPEQIAGLSNVVSVTAGNCQTFALLTNATVWIWGYGNKVPAPVPGLSNIIAICAGDYHTLALAADGTVWAWGDNGYGQLGDGGAENYSDLPVPVVGLTNVIGVAAGIWHSLAVDGLGRLWAWGSDDWGQLGDAGSGSVASQPFQVPGLSNIVSVAAGSYASAALDAEGYWWQWGAGSDWPFFESWSGQDGYPRLSPIYVNFYSGWLPVLQVLNGNHQIPHAGLEFPQPLVVRVTDANGVGLSNAPVSVEVISGDVELRIASGGSGDKGLRLTTDTNGEVTIIGYVGEYASNTNCLIRVLAASRDQIAEADFTELLVPRPTINITSPSDGANVLVGSNQNLTITVDAQAAPGGSIQEVNYSYHLNGGEETPLGIAVEYPFSFTWTNTVWWSNGFVGQYTLTAVAVDNVGVQSDPQNVNITIALDSNGNGLPDFWQRTYFGLGEVDPDADPDGDGISNSLEYRYGTVPTDFYNGRLPWLEIMDGNDQPGHSDSFLPKPVIIKVSGSESLNTFITNAPVLFTVTNGTALLAATTNDIPVSTLYLRSDSNGRASVWVYFPPSTSDSRDSTILASAISGTNSTAVVVNEFVPLGHWSFNDTNTWMGEAGQLPMLASNLAGIRSWSSNAVLVESGNPALLAYNVVETDGNTNINCRTGSVLFWFKPDWSSTNVGGDGPGAWGRLIEMGDYSPAYSDGWWGLYLSPDGTQLLFGTSANGGGMTNLSANISWYSNEWYQIALTYSPSGSALYVDGQLLVNGTGVTYFPERQ